MKSDKIAYLLTIAQTSRDEISYIIVTDNLKNFNFEQIRYRGKVVGIDLFNMPLLLSNDINLKSTSSLAYKYSYDCTIDDEIKECLVIVDRFEDILELEELQNLTTINIECLEYPVIFN